MVYSALNGDFARGEVLDAKKRIAVVIPAYCETRLLPATLASIPEFVDQIIVVDDGSPDKTYQVAGAAARSDLRVKVIRMGYNYGVGRAITRGYEYALESGADVI